MLGYARACATRSCEAPRPGIEASLVMNSRVDHGSILTLSVTLDGEALYFSLNLGLYDIEMRSCGVTKRASIHITLWDQIYKGLFVTVHGRAIPTNAHEFVTMQRWVI
jgi:hypothetical protein